jgi:hypothetical protein
MRKYVDVTGSGDARKAKKVASPAPATISSTIGTIALLTASPGRVSNQGPFRNGRIFRL